MAADRPNDDFDDELLSAYVDNELTAAQRKAVEERLRTDTRAQQLIEELRMVSQAVKSLPRERLGRDLRTSVLAEVERRLPATEPVATLPYRERDESRGGRRGLIWAAAAIAAALLLMVFLPDEWSREPQVAQGPPRRVTRTQDNELARGIGGREAPSISAAEPARDPSARLKDLSKAADAPRRDFAVEPGFPAVPSATVPPPPAGAASDSGLPTYELIAANQADVARFERLLSQRGFDLRAGGAAGLRMGRAFQGRRAAAAGGAAGEQPSEGAAGGQAEAIDEDAPRVAQTPASGAAPRRELTEIAAAAFVVEARPEDIEALVAAYNNAATTESAGGAENDAALEARAASAADARGTGAASSNGRAWRISSLSQLGDEADVLRRPALRDDAPPSDADEAVLEERQVEGAEALDRASEAGQAAAGRVRALILLRRNAQ